MSTAIEVTGQFGLARRTLAGRYTYAGGWLLLSILVTESGALIPKPSRHAGRSGRSLEPTFAEMSMALVTFPSLFFFLNRFFNPKWGLLGGWGLRIWSSEPPICNYKSSQFPLNPSTLAPHTD